MSIGCIAFRYVSKFRPLSVSQPAKHWSVYDSHMSNVNPIQSINPFFKDSRLEIQIRVIINGKDFIAN